MLGVSFGDELYPGMGPWGRKPLRCSFWIILWLWALARCFRTPATRYLWKGLCDWVGMWLQGSCATIMYFFTSCQLRPSSANSSCQISGTLGCVRWCWGSEGIHISITITINANGASTPPRRIRKFNSYGHRAATDHIIAEFCRTRWWIQAQILQDLGTPS